MSMDYATFSSAPTVRGADAGGRVAEIGETPGLVAAIVVDRAGVVRAADAAAGLRLGAVGVTGTSVSRWIAWPGACGWASVWADLLADGLLELDGHLRSADGARRPVRLLLEARRTPDGASEAIVRFWRRAVCEARSDPTVDVDWNVRTGRISVSRRWCTVFDLEPRSTMTLAQLRTLLGPVNFPRMLADTGRMVRGELERSEMTVAVRRRPGRTAWIRHRAWVAERGPDGQAVRLAARVVDITEEREAVAALQGLVERIPVAMMVHGSDGALRTWNRAAAELLGCDTGGVDAELSRRRVEGWGLVDERGRPVPTGQLPTAVALRTGRGVSDQICGFVQRGSDRVRWGSVNAHARLAADGRVVDVVTTFADLTACRRLDEADAAERRLEGIGRLAGGVAHDFNNLLATIRGNAELIRMAGDRGADELDQIIEAARRGAELTRRMLACARRVPVKRRDVLLGAHVAGLVERLAGELAREPGDIRLVGPTADGPSVSVDVGHLRAVMRELVDNACRSTGPRGTIMVTVDEVEVGSAAAFGRLRPGSYGRLRVIDHGVGMAPDVVERAFEPFFTTADPGAGSGLGLAASRGMILANGGEMRIESAVGSGTVVEVLLPRVVVVPRAPAGDREPTLGRVLLVEADRALRRSAVRVLAANGYSVEAFDEPGPALERAADGPELDLAIVGCEPAESLMAALRRRWPGLPILETTGRAGADPAMFRLERPYAPGSLCRRVEALLGRG